jgi:hypothetical protein
LLSCFLFLLCGQVSGVSSSSSSNRACLRRHFPRVWEALRELCGGDPAKRTRRDSLAQLTNALKHDAWLEISGDWSDNGGGSGGGGVEVLNCSRNTGDRLVAGPLREFAAAVFEDVRAFVRLCIGEHKRCEELFSVVAGKGQEGGGEVLVMLLSSDLQRGQPLDVVDKLGNTVLHWIGRRRDASQLQVVRAATAEMPPDRLQACEEHVNHDGEKPDLTFDTTRGTEVGR